MNKEKKYNLLYLDDEESNLRIFKAAFKQYYKIFTAKSGIEGLEVLKNEEIHLIITDQRMPKMTGVEFLERIIPDYPDPVRIIITGFADIEDIVRALNKCGIHRYIVKPWNREELKLTIDKALETYQLKKDNANLVQELQEINNNLEEKISERTAELMETNRLLHDAKEKAEEASYAKERFLSTMSHEIRTPLNAIIGVSHLLKQSPLNPEQQDNVQILEFSANNLLSLINDILDMSKIEAGKIELEFINFDLFNLLSGVYKTMQTKAQDKGLQFELELDENLPVNIIGDQVRLGQILINLVSNAVKFTENGSVTIFVKVLNETDSHVMLKFEIKDTGIGISPEMTDKIFEDFSQASSDTTRKYGGTGLGLAITKKLVTLHDSDIIVVSKPGEGSSFNFEINFEKGTLFTEEGTAKEDKPTILGDKNLQEMLILVVEDNKFNQVIARKFLTGWNAEVEFANNGVEALEKLKNNRAYKLILMDIQMPEMDGYEATRQIRSWPQPYYKEIPIIALSASTLSGEKDKAIQTGMNDYVMKPFNPDNLYNKIVTLSNSSIELVKIPTETVSDIPEGKSILEFTRFKRMVENDESFYAELLELTVEDYEEFKNDFKDAAKSEDHKILSEICHKIRPSMIVLGLDWLDNEILDYRERLKNSEISESEKHNKINYFDSELSKVIVGLQEELNTN
ncbi:response regulator [Chondrinema litorale]|uniref:response regulator n=1 Tax=Chondrinema litorale TaxID=2994555 RepID=UPI00254389A9|nr:response regulator [Chondrinema litorale]UZR93405.1 response regulator [Chondrinema litorale]